MVSPLPGLSFEPKVDESSRVERTVWGLSSLELHARYWAAHGVQVVQQGAPSLIVKQAELFLLTDPRSLVLFSMRDVIEELNWLKPHVMFLRLHDQRERGYRETVKTYGDGRFRSITRLYDAADPRLARVCITPHRDIATMWQNSPDPLTGWQRLRKHIHPADRVTCSAKGHVYDGSVDREQALFLHDLLKRWKRPDVTISRAQNADEDIWIDRDAKLESDTKLIGPVWVGAGRKLPAGATVIGPAVVWDAPEARPRTDAIQWLNIEPTNAGVEPEVREISRYNRAAKRLFDLTFAAIAMLISLPLYPLIMLAIWLEDGRPFFFGHERETIGGRRFRCWKFRSMRKDAEKLKAELAKQNQADGPQFFMQKDPRLTRVGAFIRKYNLDELPQFFNVLAGHMSVVGPRPSPYSENQFCPAWREARLSVRPGITGLWQINRTRRAGSDFQEWIKYDLQYVENVGLWTDLKIIWGTGMMMVRKAGRV